MSGRKKTPTLIVTEFSTVNLSPVVSLVKKKMKITSSVQLRCQDSSVVGLLHFDPMNNGSNPPQLDFHLE